MGRERRRDSGVPAVASVAASASNASSVFIVASMRLQEKKSKKKVLEGLRKRHLRGVGKEGGKDARELLIRVRT